MVMTKGRNRRWDEVEKDHLELSALARHFELYNRTEGKSPKTIDWYNQALTLFHRFLMESGKPTNLGNLDEHEAREFIIHLQGRRRWSDNPYVVKDRGRLAAITVQTHIRALRGFFNWLYKEGYTEENRLARLKPPKAPNKIVQVLTQEEIGKVFKCIDTNTTAGARNFAILMLFFDAGLRCGELRNFELEHINIDGGYLKVMGKGSKERVVPFGASTQKALLRYVLNFRPEPFNPIIKKFFLTLDGKPMTKNCIKMTFQRIARKSGVKRLHPHLCRHTFATNYLINGGDVFSLQQILGHTTLEMVGRYVTLASAHVTIQHRKFSPMDRINVSGLNVT